MATASRTRTITASGTAWRERKGRRTTIRTRRQQLPWFNGRGSGYGEALTAQMESAP